jgi:hypothetical protein
MSLRTPNTGLAPTGHQPVVIESKDPVYPYFPEQSFEEFTCDNGLLAAASQAYRGAQVEYNC